MDATVGFCVTSNEDSGNSYPAAPGDEDCGTSFPDDFDPYAVVVSVTGGSGDYSLMTSTSPPDGAISIACANNTYCDFTIITEDECLAGYVDITAVDQSTWSPLCDDTGKRVTLKLTSSTTFGLAEIPTP
jgi:hypothetical protein